MGKKIFISFLGLGQYNKEKKEYDYLPAIYSFNNRQSNENKFVQIGELELLNKKFDKIIILATEKSKQIHFKTLKEQIISLQYSLNQIVLINIGKREDLIYIEKHKEWFEKLLIEIDSYSKLTIDITHGYRIIPIVLSSALHFLKIIKNVEIENVLYGAFELVDRNEKVKPIIDLKDFFIITDWASAISDFVNFFDISNIIKLSKKNENLNIYNVKNSKLFERVNLQIKSAEMMQLPENVFELLQYVNNLQNDSITSQILSEMMIDKYKNLAEEHVLKYNQKFFNFQLNFIKTLIKHNLLMQAYTVMRETIASIGLAKLGKIKNIKNNDGRKKRRYAEIFIKMIQYNEDEWKFDNEAQQKQLEELKPYYEELKEIGVIEILKTFIKDLVKIRNGFDHAWTMNPFNKEVVEKAKEHYLNLENIIKILEEKGWLNN